jgi:parvulin-like peptidyl-prolyl isomerase
MSTRFSSPRAAALPVFLLLFAGASALLAADRPEPPRVVEEIVAKVNGDIVTRGDLEKAKVLIEHDLRQSGLTGPALQQQYEKIVADELRNQIDQLLLVQKGKDLDINVDADLNRWLAGVQSESKIADPDKFHDFIRQQTGMPYEDFRLRKKNELMTGRVVEEEVWRNITIPDADLQKYYDTHKGDFIRKESVRLRVILISTGDGKPDTVAAAQKKAQGLLDRARAGTDKFSDLARQYSDDPSAGDEGMLPTAFERGAGADPNKELNKAIEDVVFSHEKGYITDLIQIRGAGFAFYRVEEHVPAGQASFDDVKGEINNILTRPIADPKLRDFLTGLRQNAFLQVKAGYIDTGAAPGKDTSWKDPAALLPETTTKAAVANQRHLKKILGVIPIGYTGEKDATPAPPPTTTPVQQTPPAANSDGTPNR